MPRAKRLNEIRGVQSAPEFLQAVEHLDTLKTVPIYYGLRESVVDFDDLQRSAHRVGLVNGRTNELVGVASDKWEPVQHSEAFTEVINRTLDLVGDEQFYGRVHNNGNSASMEILFGMTDVVDRLAYGIRVSNHYRVGSVLKIESMFVRHACTNGMLWSDVSASIALNHLNKVWDADIASGVNEVVSRISSTGDLIGTRIADAMDDRISYNENEDVIKRILVGAGISEDRGLKRLQKSKWGWKGNDEFSRYDLYNMVTAYSSHLVNSVNQFSDIQRGAVRILNTPFEQLINAAAIPVQAEMVA